MLIEQENSVKTKSDSYNFVFNFLFQALRSTTPIPISSPYPILSNTNGLEIQKSLLERQRDELSKQISSLEKYKICILLTPLSYAVVKGDEKQVVKLAISYSINYKDDLGNTALHYAAKHKHFGIMKILIGKGADISIENDHYQKPLDLLPLELQKLFVYERTTAIYEIIGLPYDLCLNIVEYEYGLKTLQKSCSDQEMELLGE